MGEKKFCGCTDQELNIWRVRYCGFAFFVLFSAFQTTQTLVTPLFRSVGTIALTLLYVFFAIGAIFAPVIAAKLGFRWNFLIWALMYPLWIGTSISGLDWLFLASSIILGFAGGPFWTGQGMYVGALSKGQDVGRYNSAFNLLFFFSTPVGNLITGVLFLFNPPPSSTSGNNANVPVAALEKPVAVLWVLFGICLTGALLTLGIRVPEGAAPPHPGPVLKRILGTLKFFKKRRILCYVPYILYAGFQLGFNWGVMPTLIEVRFVPWIFVTYGLALFITAPGVGKLYDRFKWRGMVFINITIAAGMYICVPIAKTYSVDWPLYIAAAYGGIIENITTTFIQSSFLDHYKDDVAPSIAIFRMLWAIGIATGFLAQLGLNYLGMVIAEAIVCAVTIAIVITFELVTEKKAAAREALNAGRAR